MKRTTLLPVCVVALAAAAPAVAKGPADATVTGPALAKPITVRWTVGDSAHAPFGELVEGAGFFAVAVGRTPDPLSRRPNGDLGPRYTIAYGGLGHDPDTKIRQELYPYAEAGPVTYLKPGQPLYNGTTVGGWYRAPESFKQALVSMGLPPSAPAPRASRSNSRPVWMLAPIAALLLAAVSLARRPRS